MQVVFILGSLHVQRCAKRIDEFVEHGYDVDVYAFDRGVNAKKLPKLAEVTIIGRINKSVGRFGRIWPRIKGVRKVLKKYRKEQVIYYLFGLEMTSMFRVQTKRKYIYEESDLVHTYVHNRFIVRLLEWLDIRTIKQSFMTVFTSEGFKQYHFGENGPENTWIIANRLPTAVTTLPQVGKKSIDMKHLSIGFVGFLRYQSIYNFAHVFCSSFPELDFHFFGITGCKEDEELFEKLKQFGNCHFHGSFSNPNDLPGIYSQIDLVLSTYDVESENVRYAEPNKIYEAIYFKTPIIVSRGTFLADKVNNLGIGYEIDALDNEAIKSFIKSLTEESIIDKQESIDKIGQDYALNINDGFFEVLRNKVNEL